MTGTRARRRVRDWKWAPMRQTAREARRRRRGREDDGVEARVLALVGWDPRHQGAYGMAWCLPLAR